MIDFPLNLRDNDERSAWYDGSQWLSLDRFERFWPDVGLVLVNGTAVKSMMRGAIRVEYAITSEFRARFAADPDCDDDLYHGDRFEALAKVCFRSIVETAGEQDAERVAAWLTGPVLSAKKESGWHRMWSVLLYRMGEDDPSTLISHGIPSNAARKLLEIAARYRSEVDAIEERIEVTDLEPLEGWDAVVYDFLRWENPEASPLIGLRLLLDYVCFGRAWAEIIRFLQPAYIDALLQWGRANIGPKSELHEHVTIPEDVRRTWHQVWLN